MPRPKLIYSECNTELVLLVRGHIHSSFFCCFRLYNSIWKRNRYTYVYIQTNTHRHWIACIVRLGLRYHWESESEKIIVSHKTFINVDLVMNKCTRSRMWSKIVENKKYKISEIYNRFFSMFEKLILHIHSLSTLRSSSGHVVINGRIFCEPMVGSFLCSIIQRGTNFSVYITNSNATPNDTHLPVFPVSKHTKTLHLYVQCNLKLFFLSCWLCIHNKRRIHKQKMNTKHMTHEI